MVGLQQVYAANSAAIISSKQRMRYCSWCQDQYGGLEHLHFGRGSIIRHSLQHRRPSFGGLKSAICFSIVTWSKFSSYKSCINSWPFWMCKGCNFFSFSLISSFQGMRWSYHVLSTHHSKSCHLHVLLKMWSFEILPKAIGLACMSFPQQFWEGRDVESCHCDWGDLSEQTSL